MAGLVQVLRNAVQWIGFDTGRQDGAVAQAVVLIDPATGLAVSPNSVTLSGPITVSNAVEITNDAGNAIPVSGSVSVTGSVAGVTGVGYSSQVSVTRPSDTNVYAPGDVIGSSTGSTAAITLTNMGAANGHVIITDADLRIDVASVPTGMSSFRLHLYSATPASAYGDNAAWDLPSTGNDRASYLGYIDFGTPQDLGSTLYVQASSINKKLLLGASTSLFAYLQTTAGYTPNSGSVYTVRLNAINC